MYHGEDGGDARPRQDGRLNLGLGAGWFELEHRSFGIDFKTIPGRLQALDESLQIIKGMFEQEKMTLHGRHYNVTDAVCSPKPLQKPHPPIMIGGQGQRVLLKSSPNTPTCGTFRTRAQSDTPIC